MVAFLSPLRVREKYNVAFYDEDVLLVNKMIFQVQPRLRTKPADGHHFILRLPAGGAHHRGWEESEYETMEMHTMRLHPHRG
jgi:hypothetical protein